MRLPDLLRSLVPQIVHDNLFRFSASRVSDDLKHRYAFGNSMWWSLGNMSRCGFTPESVLDIGAHVGDWTIRTRQIWPCARYLMVEPQPNKHARLRELCNGSVHLAPVLVGPSQSETVVFHIGENGSSSVFNQVDGRSWDAVTTMPTRTVDSLVEEYRMNGPILIKADVQGYELEVLGGAQKTLKETEAILLETSLLPYNVGAPLFAEVVAAMAQIGFVAYDFCSFWRRQSDDAAFQVDVIFVRNNSNLRSQKPFFTTERQ
jgi:FkbM family methyltransferase